MKKHDIEEDLNENVCSFIEKNFVINFLYEILNEKISNLIF